MKIREFTDAQQIFLGSHDFQAYDDPLLQSLHDWEMRGDLWDKQVRFIQGAVNYDDYTRLEAELPQVQARYVESFAHAASTVAADGNIEELTILAVEHIVRNEDKRIRDKIGNWHSKFEAPDPSDDYVYDLAMAFADPSRVTHTELSPYVVFDQNTASEFFASRLSDHASRALDAKRQSMEGYAKVHARRGLGVTALRFVRSMGSRLLIR